VSDLAERHVATPEKVRQLEAAIRELPEQFDIEANTSHHFCGGLYARELFVPAGYTIVGKRHASQNFFLLVRGEMSVSLGDGTVARIRAPFMCVTQPGDKRVGFAHEDSVCINFHANPDDEQDLAVLEQRYITPEALPAPQEKELIT
jgi:hypothetical protein